MLAGIKEKMVEINGGPLETDQDRPFFHLDSKVDGYCGLCNVPGVNGTGMGSCEVADDCGALNLPDKALRYNAPYVAAGWLTHFD